MMKSIVAILALVSLVAAQQPGASTDLDSRLKPDTGKPTGANSVSLEQRTVDQQNQLLSTSFARAFPDETPLEFQPLVVALYMRCQAELDNCADFLWETHLLREYRNCAMAQRRLCTQEMQELQAQLKAMADAENDLFELSPEEEAILLQLNN
ncbi:uncharacterized protein LOC128728863 [Anopheles nili]|uniref:uncharacterized protein LOC128728863 n=1 Tax=Anopheles nili TaxID=185578 RepID=UPI00237A64D3|nr:uncharacterized protein LOC128728863 [Anopheles nili]